MKNINIIFQNSFLIFTRLYRETLCYNVFNDIDKIFADIIIIKTESNWYIIYHQ